MIQTNRYQIDEDMPLFLIDFYKHGHVFQYVKGLTKVYVNFTPRSSRVEGETGVVFFGLQRFIKKVLVDEFDKHFFNRPWVLVEAQYKQVMKATLGVDSSVEHLRKLHQHGKLPLKIYALPEGTYVPLGVPACVIVNTEDWAFWLPNYIETMMSNDLWGPCTSATTAHRYRRVFLKHAKAAGETNFDFVNWMGHDFSYRGLMGREAAKLSGMGHLLSFSGTDTLPAILEAVKYYDADLSCGGSVPATEHSVMCAGSKENEQETFRRLIEDVYPSGIVSIVSDTWDLWKVLTEIIPNLKDKILARDGKVVIRPDSGDPVKILVGDPYAPFGSPARAGALRLLAKALGTMQPGGGMINKGGLIYGDSITVDRADEILEKATRMGFSPYNFVFGIGSYTYQYVTRDTYNFAFKATAIEREVPAFITLPAGKRVGVKKVTEAIFKDPVTDNAHKKSHRGIPVVVCNVDKRLDLIETLNPELLDNCAFQKVFEDSGLLVNDNFEAIRQRVRSRDWVGA